MSKFLISSIVVSLFCAQIAFADEIVVEDGDVKVTKEELAYQVEKWTPQMRDAAIKDDGDRLELVNMVLVNKKVANEAAPLLADHPELKTEYESGLENYQRNFVLTHYRDTLKLPDFSKLAKERYTTQKDKYALVPERRISSQILIKSPPGTPRGPALAEAEDVLKQLRAGADFQEMVKEHSDEPGAVRKKGKFDRWVKFGEMGVEPRYTQGLFSIAKVGEFSEPVQSQFGVHIIRLDGIKPSFYKPFDEVKAKIEEDLANEYVRLAMKDYITRFNMGENAVVDDDAVKAVLEPYAEAQKKAEADAKAKMEAEAAAEKARLAEKEQKAADTAATPEAASKPDSATKGE